MEQEITKINSKRIAKITSVVLLIAASISSWYVSYRAGLVTTYNDAMSHLDIARFVIDSKQTGLAQLGSVWLPMNHLLDLTLVWNNWAWHSGFAGSFFSMLAYIFSAIGVYKIVKELSGNVWASIAGAAAFALNPNMLYLQTTPLTEPLYLVLVISSIYFIIKFFKTEELPYLLLAGVFGFFQVLTRYDGWFVVFIEGLVLLYHQRFVAKLTFQESIAKILLFAVPIVFAVVLWLTWNQLIFGSALYFLIGPYSAHAQQVAIQNTGGLITKHNLAISLKAYWYSVSANIGNYLVVLAVLGLLVFIFKKNKDVNLKTKILVFILLLSPVLFNILALYLGFSILNVPALHWNPSGTVAGQWFNVRYGIMALPFAAVFAGLLADIFKKKYFAPALLLLVLIVGQSYLIYKQGLITVTDGTIGSSSFNDGDIAQVLGENVKPGENVLMSISLYNAVGFTSNLPLSDFVYEGVSDEWQKALVQPQNYAEWIVMANGSVGDPVYNALHTQGGDNFLKDYKLFYSGAHADIYVLRTPDEIFVSANGTNLMLGQNEFAMQGVNSYDLAYQSTSTIDATFKNLSSIGVTTVRFWMFGDGNPDGFQPEAGIVNEARFDNADYAIADAKNYHIRLVPVLVNNWTDYGGVEQYLKWVGDNPSDQDAFYTDPNAISLFENYINHVITRNNTVNGLAYSNDPTIAAWEIINEPRFSSTDSQAYINWVSEITTYIRQKDQNHLITVETDDTGANYCALLAVDICSEHLYLYNGSTSIYSTLDSAEASLHAYIQTTQRDNKPFVLGEVGISKQTNPFGQSPAIVLRDIIRANTGSGSLIWNWSEVPDTSYGFSPLGTNGVYTLKDLSNILGGPTPSKLYLIKGSTATGGYDVSTPEVDTNVTSTLQIGTSTTSATTTTLTATSTNSSDDSTPIVVVRPEGPTSTTSGNASSGTTTELPPPQTVATAKPLPYSTDVFASNDWTDGWGSVSTSNGLLTLGSDASNTSAAVFLAGSNSWTDYVFNADIQWVKGALFVLVARRTDDSNLVNCVFSDIDTPVDQVSINRVYNNVDNVMGDGRVYVNNAAHIDESNIQVSMKVQGNDVECSIDGGTVLDNVNKGLPATLLNGGVGFQVWDSQPGNSKIIVKNISVTPIN